MRPGAKGPHDACAAGQNDEVGERDLLAAGDRAVELGLDVLQDLQRFLQLLGLVDFPLLLRREANARAVRTAALVGAAERGRRRPGRRHELRDRQP
jgi:hypothetical protein